MNRHRDRYSRLPAISVLSLSPSSAKLTFNKTINGKEVKSVIRESSVWELIGWLQLYYTLPRTVTCFHMIYIHICTTEKARKIHLNALS